MLLTKKELNEILRSRSVSILPEFKKELLEQYGNLATNDEGHVHEYTEQDIYEQLRKRFRPYENIDKKRQP